MRIKYLTKLKQINIKNISAQNERIIWQILAENSFEFIIIDYLSRFFEIETINNTDGVMTILDDELVYHTSYLKLNFIDSEFINDLQLGFVYEKGGISKIEPIRKVLIKLKDFISISADKSGITFSSKKFSEFYK